MLTLIREEAMKCWEAVCYWRGATNGWGYVLRTAGIIRGTLRTFDLYILDMIVTVNLLACFSVRNHPRARSEQKKSAPRLADYIIIPRLVLVYIEWG